MRDLTVDISKAVLPTADGEVRDYTSEEAVESGHFDYKRKVVFVNGMGNTPKSFVESAVTLSLVQMCTVTGAYNASGGFLGDIAQCVGDKNQFDGLWSQLNKAKVAAAPRPAFGSPAALAAAEKALSRNPTQFPLFGYLRANRVREIFAHSQGNLILSNVLQALVTADGPGAISGYKVYTFGSPAVNWPDGLTLHENGFTFDMVSWMAGFDTSWTISKVGMPQGSLNPFTHGFLEYMNRDPAFVVNRFRVGGLGVTFNMDEEGLAECLEAMGTNTARVFDVVEYLDDEHNSDADDVAVLYVERVRKTPKLAAAVKADAKLKELLIRVMDEGWTSDDEKAAIAFLRA